MPMVDNCCGCWSLRTGTIVTGVLGIVGVIITFIMIILTAVQFKPIIVDVIPPLVEKIIMGINLAMTILISILLIVGAVKRKTWYMLPWIVLGMILIVGAAISVIYTSVEYFIDKSVLYGSVSLVIGLILTAVHIYLWLVVFSFYQLVKEEKNRGPYMTPPRI